ncbi:putative sugar lactone lactonase YvrE [Belonocnema kinseyi]|uniref:putative sugar lactone lactonase YvrE n=1 Tax=Belonocnema kinseyi TaxID=2817044 RepID=UPI00143DAA18|nr:putative sugar lactone lactonase YvrE [Belonocnema kinseyi]
MRIFKEYGGTKELTVNVEQGPLSFAVPVSDFPEEFVLGAGNSIILINWNSDINEKNPEHVVLASEKFPQGNRWGYGNVDLQGRLWIATTNDYPLAYLHNYGILFSLNNKLVLEQKLQNLCSITGGFVWDRPMEENKRRSPPFKFYYADTPRKEVVVYDFATRNGGLPKNRKELFSFKLHDTDDHPGRIAIDSRGWLWVPLIGGHKVIEFDPVRRMPDRVIDIPAAKVGACTFGGAYLDILYVSTIGYEYRESHQHRPPGDEGGHIYAIHNLGVTGRPTEPYLMILTALPENVRRAREHWAQLNGMIIPRMKTKSTKSKRSGGEGSSNS